MERIKKYCIILVLASCLFACQKDETSRLDKQEQVLKTYNKYIEDINSGRISSSLYVYTDDGGGLYRYTQDDGGITKINSEGGLDWIFDFESFNTSKNLDGLVHQSGGIVTMVFEHTESSILIMRLNKNGELLWQKTIEGFDIQRVCDMASTTDNGVVILCTIYEPLSDNNINILVISIDKRGNINLKKKDYSINYKNQYPLPLNIIQTADLGYLVTFSSPIFVEEDIADSYIIKLDQNGYIRHSNTTFDNHLPNLFKANDNGFISARSRNTEADISEIIVVKIDETGEIEWENSNYVYSQNNLSIYHIENVLDTGYLLICKANEYFILTLDNNGNLIKEDRF